MAENVANVGRPVNVVTQVKNILGQENVKKRFQEVLGKSAPQFMASIVNCVASSEQLKKADPNSIMAAAFVAATYDLPIDSNLGFAAIVPYNNMKYDPAANRKVKVTEAQFQMMYKGFIQLAIRSGYYEDMNYASIYEDELVAYNPITGEAEFVSDFSGCRQRANGEEDKIVGYYAWFRLKTGFRHSLYMSRDEVRNHARKYSQSYRYDLNNGKKSSRWSVDFEAMALKTVIKRLINKWGIMSIDMQRAIADDQKTYDEGGQASYGDNQPEIPEVQNPFEEQSAPAQIPERIQTGVPAEFQYAAQAETVSAYQEGDVEEFDITGEGV